jgi:hypothetical protein
MQDYKNEHLLHVKGKNLFFPPTFADKKKIPSEAETLESSEQAKSKN